jgi:hypothetical protein
MTGWDTVHAKYGYTIAREHKSDKVWRNRFSLA